MLALVGTLALLTACEPAPALAAEDEPRPVRQEEQLRREALERASESLPHDDARLPGDERFEDPDDHYDPDESWLDDTGELSEEEVDHVVSLDPVAVRALA